MGSAALEGGGIDSPAADLEGKAGEEGERVYNHFIAYPLALAGALFFGVGNSCPGRVRRGHQDLLSVVYCGRHPFLRLSRHCLDHQHLQR